METHHSPQRHGGCHASIWTNLKINQIHNELVYKISSGWSHCNTWYKSFAITYMKKIEKSLEKVSNYAKNYLF